MSKIKVLYLYDNFPSYRKDFFGLLNQSLSAEGLEFFFYYGSKNVNASCQENESSFPVRSFSIERKNWGVFRSMSYKGFKDAFVELKPNIVVLQFHVAIMSYWWAYFYMKKHHIPFIIWDCNYTRETLGGPVFREYLLKLGRKPGEIFVAQNTINIQKIIEKRSAYCRERRFNHPLRVLYVGAILGRKFVDSSIIAVEHLIKQGYDIYYDIVGNGSDFEKLKRLIKSLNVEDRIVLYGAKHGDEVKAFFEKDDLFLLPGTGGLAINEAMAYALPIISTVGDDTVVDLIDGNGIMLQKFGDVDEIEIALKTFISLPEEDKIKMANKSEQIVKERASLENMVSQHVKAIKYALEKGK